MLAVVMILLSLSHFTAQPFRRIDSLNSVFDEASQPLRRALRQLLTCEVGDRLEVPSKFSSSVYERLLVIAVMVGPCNTGGSAPYIGLGGGSQKADARFKPQRAFVPITYSLFCLTCRTSSIAHVQLEKHLEDLSHERGGVLW